MDRLHDRRVISAYIGLGLSMSERSAAAGEVTPANMSLCVHKTRDRLGKKRAFLFITAECTDYRERV